MIARRLLKAVVFAILPFVLTDMGFGEHDVLRPSQAFVPMAEFEPESPPKGLDGYCPVTLELEERWVDGRASLRAEFEGHTFFFAKKEYQEAFLDEPVRFAPVFSGMDVVQQAEMGVLADGFRAHGVFYKNRVFLFVNEEHLQKFWNAPWKYAPRYMDR